MSDKEILFYTRLLIWLILSGMIASGIVAFILIIVFMVRVLF